MDILKGILNKVKCLATLNLSAQEITELGILVPSTAICQYSASQGKTQPGCHCLGPQTRGCVPQRGVIPASELESPHNPSPSSLTLWLTNQHDHYMLHPACCHHAYRSWGPQRCYPGCSWWHVT